MRIPLRLFSASLSWLVAGTNTGAKHSFASIDTNKSSIPALFMLIVGVSGLGLSQNVLSDVSGIVYRDLPVNGSSINQYGIKEANELGEAGITVTVFDSSGTVVGASVTTAQDGTWSVTGTSGDVRVEFSGIPSYLASSPVNTGSNTTVQFVADGATTVDLGLHEPADYSDTAVPEVVLSSWVGGKASAAGATNASLYSFPFDRNGQNEDDTFTDDNLPGGNGTTKVPAPTIDAIASETGATWGLAYQKNQKRYFASSVVRRHTGLADGTGFIYVIDKSAVSASVAHKFDLNGIITMNGGTIDLGSICRGGGCESDAGNTTIEDDYLLANNISSPSVDLDAMKKVGKVAFGDIDMQPQTNYLWAVNLNQKALIKINVGDDDATQLPVLAAGNPDVDQFLISGLSGIPVCTNGGLRPWGLNFSNGKGYLGIACDAENSGTTSDLTGFVMSFNPEDVTAGFVEEISFPLGFTRKGDDTRYTFAPWSHDWDDFRHMFSSRYTLPQAIVSDIEFDKAGNMNIALIDRAGMQLGTSNYKPISGVPISGNPGGANDLVQNQTRGDLFHACKTTTGFEMEGSVTCPINFVDDQGFNLDGEFFEERAGDGDQEGALGALAMLKGSNKMVMTILDPHPTGDVGRPYWTSQGVNFVHPESGTIEQYYTLYKSSSRHEFGKASGLGDVELLTAPAPVEIGNRVWEDSNGDGLQGADENPISGVAVKLYENNVLVGSVNSSASGEYYFGGIGDTNMSRGETLKPLTDYQIRVSLTDTTLTGMTLTQQDANSNGSNSYDSDGDNGTLNTGFSTIAYTTGHAGVNDHTLDFGFVPLVAIGNKVWIDNGAGNGTANNGIKDGTETGVNNVAVELRKQSDDSLVASTTTNGTGHYQFDNQLPGNYYIKISATEFGSGKPLVNLLSSTGAGTGDADETVDENGIDDANPASNGIRTAAYTLSVGGEPSGEATQSAYTGSLPDNSVNMTADFGFVPLVAIGNKVWIDNGAGNGTANNGIKDGTESGVDNVKVELRKQSDDSLVASTNTNPAGHYQFDNQLPGEYYINIPATEFGSGKPLANLLSSTGAGSGDADETVDENGIDDANPASNGIRTAAYMLSVGGEPSGEATQSAYTGSLPDNSVNMTADFGFVALVAIGNKVWIDNGAGNGTANNGIKDGTESGVDNVAVELRKQSDDSLIASTNTNPAGHYQFDNQLPGEYYINIPATEFGSGKPLANLLSSTGAGSGDADENTDENGIDNADPASNGIRTAAYTLSAGGEPSGEATQTAYTGSLPDNSVNMTADFGFVTVGMSLGDFIWWDVDGNGTQGGTGETGVKSVKVELFAANGSTPATDLDGNTVPFQTTDTDGLYLFTNLQAGDYVVQITPSVGYQLTTGGADPDDDSNTDSNGYVTGAGKIQSHPVTLSVNSEPDNDGDSDKNSNLSVDFGLLKFDLALRKKVDSVSDTPLIPGTSTVTFEIEVFNQGEIAASNIEIVDYLGSGFSYDAADNTGVATGNANDWSSAANPTLIIPGPIAAGASATVNIILTVDADTHGQKLTNAAEISDDGSNIDIDSMPDSTDGNDVTVDDEIDNTGGDQDDHDIASIQVETFDLALRKTVDSQSHPVLIPGTSTVTFAIEVFNQGDVNASDVHIVDYITAGFTYDAAANTAALTGNVHDWSAEPDPDLLIDTINAGQSQVVKIVLGIDIGTIGQTLDNFAEIADDGATAGTDIDSIPDANNSENPVKDNVITEDGKNNITDDEDDHDVAMVTVEGFDLALRKKVGTLSDDPLIAGSSQVTFTIEVINQGDVAASDITLVDYIQTGFSYNPAENTAANTGNTNNWSADADPLLVIPGPIAAGASATVKIILDVKADAAGKTITNYAEIADDNQAVGTDVDSTPDSNNTENPVKDDVVNEDGKNTSGDDEDDHDIADVTVPGARVAIGNTVWIDDGAGSGIENNGIKDGSEAGVNGVAVELRKQSDNSLVDSTTTNAAGHYQFDEQLPGNYYVKIPATQFDSGQPLENRVSSTGAGTDNSDEDSDENGIDNADPASNGIRSMAYSLSVGGEPTGESTQNAYTGSLPDDSVNMTVDFGFYTPVPNVHIGNLVWIEDDNNGDATDGVITFPPAGTIVTATASDGNTTYTDTTDANGLYDIEVPANDTYVVTVATPSGTVPTAGSADNAVPDETAENNLSHDGSGTTVVVTTIDNFTLDFGFTPPPVPNVHIGNLVWIEDDNNGDATDGVITFPPVGTIVTATASDGNTTYTDTTDANGLYDIEVPANDTYVVTVATPSGTVPTAGSADNAVPDETAENNLTHDGSGTTVVVTTIDNFTLDFGFTTQSNAGVTGVVWFDTDKDGVKDPDENGLPGWTIEIIDSNGTPVQSLTTLPDGTFSDLNLGTGDYTIRFLSPGGIIIKDQTITLNPGDVAFVPEPIDPAGIIYNEQTGAPIPGAQVFLTNNGTALPAACLGAGEQGQVTGVDGAYNFFLNPGADPACPATDTVYGIQVIPPANYQTTVNNPPQAGVLDSDNCTIDAIAGVTCEVSDQIVVPIIGIPPYFIEVEIGVGDPGVFNNHIPLTPPSVVLPPTPNIPVKPIPTLSEWGRIMLMLLIGVITLMQQGRRRGEFTEHQV